MRIEESQSIAQEEREIAEDGVHCTVKWDEDLCRQLPEITLLGSNKEIQKCTLKNSLEESRNVWKVIVRLK